MPISKLFTYFSALGVRTGTATATAGAATLNAESGVVTTETGVNTAAGSTYTLTITNSRIKATDMVMGSVAFGTATTGEPVIERQTPANGSLVVRIRNNAAAAAFNGSLKYAFVAFKA